MSVKIRLKRMGAKKRPFYRIVVADSRAPRDGRFIDTLGHYNPCVEPPDVKVDTERAQLWLSRGAQPTQTASALLKKQGMLQQAAPAVAVAVEAPAPAKRKRAAKAEAAPAALVAEAPAASAAEEPVAEQAEAEHTEETA